MNQIERHKGLDYNNLPDRETRAFIRKCEATFKLEERRGAESIWTMGKVLCAAKDCLKHGEFLDWIEGNLGTSERMSRHFMRVFQTFKSENFSDLRIEPSALYALAAPSTPDEARGDAIALAETGATVTHAKAREIIAAHKPEIAPQSTPEIAPVDDDEKAVLNEALAQLSAAAYNDDETDDEAETVDPLGMAATVTTEVMNAELPSEATPAAKLSKAEEDDLSDADWMETLPLTKKLRDENMVPLLFSTAALNYRRLQSPIGVLRRAVDAAPNMASDAFSIRMALAAATPHPSKWIFSRDAIGGFIL